MHYLSGMSLILNLVSFFAMRSSSSTAAPEVMLVSFSLAVSTSFPASSNAAISAALFQLFGTYFHVPSSFFSHFHNLNWEFK